MLPPAPLLLLLLAHNRDDGPSGGAGPPWRCPRRCVCAGDILDCSGRGLSDDEAPARVPDRFSALDLSGNALALVPAFLAAAAAADGAALAGAASVALARNRVSALPPGLLGRAVPHAERLDLSVNALRDVPRGAFAGLTRLRALELQGNEIRRMSRGAFRGLPALRRLYLGGNRLRALPVAAVLRAAPSLALLDLSSNHARAFPPALPPARLRAAAVFLHGNPFACGCRVARALGELRGAGYRPVLDHWPDFRCVDESVDEDDDDDDGPFGKMTDIAEFLSDGAGSRCAGAGRHDAVRHVARAGTNVSLSCPVTAAALPAGDEEPASFEWITPDNRTVGDSPVPGSGGGAGETAPARRLAVAAVSVRGAVTSRLLIVDAVPSDSGVYSCRRRPRGATARVRLTVAPRQPRGGDDNDTYYDDDDGADDEPATPDTVAAPGADTPGSFSTLVTMVAVCAASLLLVLAYVFLTPCPCRRRRCSCPCRRGRYGGAFDFVPEAVAPFSREAAGPPAPPAPPAMTMMPAPSAEPLAGAPAVRRVAFLEP